MVGATQDNSIPPPSVDPLSRFVGMMFYFPERAQVSNFDSSLQDNMFQIVLDGRRYCVDETVLRVLEYFRTGVPAEDALRSREGQNRPPCSPQLVGKLFDRGLIRTAQEVEDETLKGRGPKSKRPPGMFFLIPILSERTIAAIARIFCPLFRPLVAGFALVGIVLVHLIFLFGKHASHTGHLTSAEFFCLVGLVLLALLFHELGHASASEHFGVHPHALGFGVFWIYPVMFTDVSGTWQLPRWQRALVGAAGLYFHLLASGIACLATLVVSSRLPVLLVYSIWLAVFLNGNPFLQFDGYWIVTDLLGIPNLRYQTHSLLKRVLAKLTGRIPPDQGLWQSSHRMRVPVIVYTIAYCGFVVYVADVLCSRILPRLFVSVPLAYQSVAQLISSGRLDLNALLIIWRATVVIITIAGLTRILHRILAYLYRSVRSFRLERQQRGVA
jgi:putative peptide zinc metalloprotease protein